MSCPLVIIRWHDSTQPTPAWRHLANLPKFQAVECASVGWLIESNDQVKVLSQSIGGIEVGGNAQCAGVMTIPTVCVVSLEYLTEVEHKASEAA